MRWSLDGPELKGKEKDTETRRKEKKGKESDTNKKVKCFSTTERMGTTLSRDRSREQTVLNAARKAHGFVPLSSMCIGRKHRSMNEYSIMKM